LLQDYYGLMPCSVRQIHYGLEFEPGVHGWRSSRSFAEVFPLQQHTREQWRLTLAIITATIWQQKERYNGLAGYRRCEGFGTVALLGSYLPGEVVQYRQITGRDDDVSEQEPQIELDRLLARRVTGGDRKAFDQFFREYFPRLFRFTLSRVDNDSGLAEEIVQRTMCIVVRKMGTYRGEALLFTWLCQICRNETQAVFRQRRIEMNSDVGIEDHPAVQAALESFLANDRHPEAVIYRDEIAKFVRITLTHLPANYATALEMKYVQGCSVMEIGEQLGIGTKAAESVLSRARGAFREGFRSLCDFKPGFIVD
jgi:RNA polymerase sigma-70 factor (ECF subfamily)